jgi:mannose-6-phosphate isomerase-like protein (cupin superfamily)
MPDLFVKYREVDSYITKDESTIRELMHPDLHGSTNQSLAEASIPPGIKTRLHYHRQSEELYHVTAGQGLMTLGDRQLDVGAGDTICIPAGTEHCIENTGEHDLKILCSCAPAYSHEDTVLVD